MRVAAVLVAVLAFPAQADRLLCSDAAAVKASAAKLTASNVKARDAALAAVGLKPVTASLVARGAQTQAPAGNIVWLKLGVGCNADVASMVVFAADKKGKVYRVMPKTTYTEVSVYACGSPSCSAPCGTPPEEQSYAFRLPDKLVYSGEKEVAWKMQVARVSYDVPGTCDKNGQFTPSSQPATPPTPGPAASGELAKLRAENAKLKSENEKLRDEIKKLQAQQAAEVQKLKDKQKGMAGAGALK